VTTQPPHCYPSRRRLLCWAEKPEHSGQRGNQDPGIKCTPLMTQWPNKGTSLENHLPALNTEQERGGRDRGIHFWCHDKSRATMEPYSNPNVIKPVPKQGFAPQADPSSFSTLRHNIQTVNSSQLVATGRVQTTAVGRQFWRIQHRKKSTDSNICSLSLLCADVPSPCQRHVSWSLLLVTRRQHASALRPGTGICKLLEGRKGETGIA